MDIVSNSQESGGELIEVYDDQDDSYSYEELLEEASDKYGDGKPKFCTADQGETERSVKLCNRNDVVRLTFQRWKTSKWGYWLFVDGIRDEYIVKHMRGQYFTWQGEQHGFSDTPIANPIKSVPEKQSHSVINESDADFKVNSPRDFRARTLRQEKPYQMYNAQMKMESQGVSLTDSDLERRLAIPQSSCKPKRKAETVIQSETPDRPQKHRSISSMTSATSGISARTESTLKPASNYSSELVASAVSDDMICEQAVLRTRLKKDNGAYIAVFLTEIGSSEQLFQTLRDRWAFKLAGEPLGYCVARFRWLDDDASILIQESDEDGFRQLFEEIRRAPAWQAGEQVDVAVELHTS